MGYLLDLPKLHNLKLEIGNNRDHVFHFPSQEEKMAGFTFPQTLSLVTGPSKNHD